MVNEPSSPVHPEPPRKQLATNPGRRAALQALLTAFQRGAGPWLCPGHGQRLFLLDPEAITVGEEDCELEHAVRADTGQPAPLTDKPVGEW